MKRVVLAIVTTITSLVLLLSFKTHSQSAVATPTVVAKTTTPETTTTTKATKTKTSTKATTKAATYTGSAVQTRYGPVQVQITVKSGEVASASAVVYPTNSPLDAQINSYAIPALDSEAASAGSASIDMVSGATFTSEGYISSLQSALDQAGL
jgi:uncharacterized protein with FMN-binding domain